MPDAPVHNPQDVLIVDDDEIDVELAEYALKRIGTSCRCHVAKDGDVALDFLRRTGEHREAPRPGLVLLDIKMPRMGGLEVLREVKADPALSCIPIVMLTSSGDQKDVEEAYRHHANGFLVKSVDLREFQKAIETVTSYWFRAVRVPDRRGPGTWSA